MAKKQSIKSNKNKKTTTKVTAWSGKKRFKLSPKNLALFVLLFMVIGTALLVKSFAGSNTILVFPGEKLVGSGAVLSDPIAKSGYLLKLTNSTEATGKFTTNDDAIKVLILARGDQCNGAPNAVIKIDGINKLSADITTTTLSIYVDAAKIPSGTHTISAMLSNPYKNTTCSRNLYLDVIYLEKSPTAAFLPSGQAMPVGDLPGWTQIFTDDFNSDAPLGKFDAVYGSRWRSYSGPDTAGKIYAAKKSEYNSPKVVSVSGGVLDKYLHSESDANGYNGSGTYMMAAGLLPRLPDQLYGRYTVRLKADAVDGYKIAWLLWPDSGIWPRDGEIDFAETDLTGSLKAFIHRQNATAGSDQTACHTDPAVSLSSGWHTVTLEWGTTTKIYVDGVLECSSTDRIPNTPMHLVLQTESEINSTRVLTSKGHLQLDWVAVYKKN